MSRFIKPKPLISNGALLKLFEGSESDRNRALQLVFRRNFPSFRQFVLKQGGTEEDANEILQQVMVNLVEKSLDQGLKEIKNIQGYVFRACKNRWLNQLRSQDRETSLSSENIADQEERHIDPYQILEQKDLRKAVDHMLSTLGEKCKKLLLWSLGDGVEMKQVAKDLNYENAQTAMNLKSRCKKKLKNLVQQNKGYQQLVKQIIFPQ